MTRIASVIALESVTEAASVIVIAMAPPIRAAAVAVATDGHPAPRTRSRSPMAHDRHTPSSSRRAPRRDSSIRIERIRLQHLERSHSSSRQPTRSSGNNPTRSLLPLIPAATSLPISLPLPLLPPLHLPRPAAA